MDILRRIPVPTGDILIVQGEKGKLECLSLGDYGKDVNLNQNRAVLNGTPLLPLTEKWVITISTQYGCSMGCAFCDVPKVGPGKNATLVDLYNQVACSMSLHPEITTGKRLNIHFARMGEPTWNPEVLKCGIGLKAQCWFNVHPVVSTMMPKKNKKLTDFILEWMFIKNEIYQGEAGLQLSINSTDEEERTKMFNGSALTLKEIAEIMKWVYPKGRKITLNFAIAGYTVDPKVLLQYFDPKNYVCKLTPMHKTATAEEKGIKTEGDYTTPEPYVAIENELKKAGYDVLVFIASDEEDSSRITCGNAILSGTMPKEN